MLPPKLQHVRAILRKDDAGIMRQDVERPCRRTVESVGLAQLQPGSTTQLVVGYTAAQGDHYRLYSYTDGVLSTILEQQYQYLVEDITGGGNQDLILMSALEDGGVQIELLTVRRLQQVAVMGLSRQSVRRLRLGGGGCGCGRRALSGAGWLDRHFPATIWPACCCVLTDTQQMVPADQIPAPALPHPCAMCPIWSVGIWTATASWRSHPAGRSGPANASQSRRMDFYRVDGLYQPHPEKSFGLLVEETNCYIRLPWSGRETSN